MALFRQVSFNSHDAIENLGSATIARADSLRADTIFASGNISRLSGTIYIRNA